MTPPKDIHPIVMKVLDELSERYFIHKRPTIKKSDNLELGYQSAEVTTMGSKGFDGRVFLHREEWETYMRRMPVRYIRKPHVELCIVCGKPPEKDNPLQHSHIIGFNVGIRKFGLTPTFLDDPSNIQSAHRKHCNAVSELPVDRIGERLRSLGYSSHPEWWNG